MRSAKCQSFELQLAEGRILRGDLYHSTTPSEGTVILCHGFKGFKDWGMFPYVAEQLSDRLDVLVFNFTFNGVGENLLDFTELERFAQNTYTRDLEDLAFLISTLQDGTLPIRSQIKSMPLFLLGHSKGAGTSLVYALDYPDHVQGVICWNGITQLNLFSTEEKEQMLAEGRAYTLNGRTKQNMPLDKIILEDLEEHHIRFNIKERVKQSDVPILLIQGSEDFQGLREGSAQLVHNQPAVKWFTVSGGNHTFGAVHPFKGTTPALEEAIHLTKTWIRNQS